MKRRFTVLLSTLALAAMPAEAQRPCLTAPEAESLALVAMPEIIRDTGAVCITRLPANSLIRQTHGGFIEKYEHAADHAWPAAEAAIVKLSDPMVSVLLQSQYARPLLTTLLVPQLVGKINTDDCSFIDRVVTDLAPLPPANAAGLVVTTLQHLKAEQEAGKQVNLPKLPLCAEPR